MPPFTELLVFVVILNLKAVLSVSIPYNMKLNKFNNELIKESEIKVMFNELDRKEKLKFLSELIAQLQKEEEKGLEINDKDQYQNTSDGIREQELQDESTTPKKIFVTSTEMSSASASLTYKADGVSTVDQSKVSFLGNTDKISEQPVTRISSDEYVVGGPNSEETMPDSANRKKQELENINTTSDEIKYINSHSDFHHLPLYVESVQEPNSSLFHSTVTDIEDYIATATEHIADLFADIENKKNSDGSERSVQAQSIVTESNSNHEINLTVANANENFTHFSTEKQIEKTDDVSIQKNQTQKKLYDTMIETITETNKVNNWNYKNSHGGELNDVKEVNSTTNDFSETQEKFSKPNDENYDVTYTEDETSDVGDQNNKIYGHIKLNYEVYQPNNENKIAKELINDRINVKQSSNERNDIILPDHDINIVLTPEHLNDLLKKNESNSLNVTELLPTTEHSTNQHINVSNDELITVPTPNDAPNVIESILKIFVKKSEDFYSRKPTVVKIVFKSEYII